MDEMEENIIPQVPITTLLSKFDGKTKQESGTHIRTYKINRLPPYLILYVKRFGKNNWTSEKNPTIVNFPIQDLSLTDIMASAHPNEDMKDLLKYNYNLQINISHQGGKEPGAGQYFIHTYHPGLDQWFQIQDLTVTSALHQMLFLSESYLQIWERKDFITPPIRAQENNQNYASQPPPAKKSKN